MRYCITLALVLVCFAVKAQQEYLAVTIPKQLTSYAGAVVRNSETEIEVDKERYYTYRTKYAVTVLNESGNHAAEIVVFYDKLRSVRSLKGAVYNAMGVQVGKFGERDFHDFYAANDFSLFEDTRVKYFRPVVLSYPYTLVYEYEIRSKQTLNFPDWMPAREAGVAIEKSTFTITCSPSFAIRYKEFNLPQKVTESTSDKGVKTYAWQIANLKAVRYEPYSPAPETYLPIVRIAPQSFSYGDMHGEFTNWAGLGKWVYDELLTGRDVLPPSTVSRVKDLTNGITDPKERARKVYEYMQGKTRYISVQVGVGGYQPFPAADVDRLGYGDCKALVNYTYALLKAVDVPSYYCAVSAGDEKESFDPDFASMSGNHVILCLPFKNDTTFLECTSQKVPFGYLGDFTDDRLVLACTAEGGKLLRTTKYSGAESLQKRTAQFSISTDGELKGKMKTAYYGWQYEQLQHLADESATERLKEYKRMYTINNMEVQKLDILQDKGIKPVTNEDVELSAVRFATIAAGKLYFTPNLANRRSSSLREISNRRTGVYIPRGYTDVDEITYTLPPGYKVDKELLNVSVEKPFGKYTAVVTMEGDVLVYKRTIQMIDGTYDKEMYPELVSFYDRVYNADNYSLTLSRQ